MKWYFLILPLLLVTGCSRPKGFTLKKVLSRHQNEPRWEVSLPQQMDEIQRILTQPYSYLGSGNHCYAFVSRDGRYVLKFFKQKHMRTQSILSKRRLRRRRRERVESFTSYKIAYEELQEETGVLYLHLNKTVDILPTLTLFDQHGNLLTLPLDEMEFLIQKRATLAFDYLESLFDQKEQLLSAVDSLLRLVAVRSQRGIYDKDLQFYKNFGFCEGQAIEVDIGEFNLDHPPKEMLEEVGELSLQIRDFIHENAAELLSDVEARINLTLRELER